MKISIVQNTGVSGCRLHYEVEIEITAIGLVVSNSSNLIQLKCTNSLERKSSAMYNASQSESSQLIVSNPWQTSTTLSRQKSDQMLDQMLDHLHIPLEQSALNEFCLNHIDCTYKYKCSLISFHSRHIFCK